MEEIRGTYLVTADHGNAEDMVQRDKKTKKALMEDGKPRMLTSHTLNPVGSFLCSRRSPVPSELCLLIPGHDNGPHLSTVRCGHALSQQWCNMWLCSMCSWQERCHVWL